MSRWIDADEAVNALCKGCGWYEGQCDNDKGFWCETRGLIEEATHIDIEPKRGENLLKDYPSLFECSVCGASCNDTFPWDCDINFCPNCGADMRAEQTEPQTDCAWK